ncbi:UDP-glucose 6-dehydrogenase [Candidatus Woesearchaeota archaeon B3_Woes]|nr:MAG: UDP-glucose 6-dehydrogenase [Candidatus Woesearchaeota archaeon B3_Woes]
MKISVFGAGYVGLVVGSCLADLGNDVICVDVDVNKVENLKKGKIPIYEPGLKEIIDRNLNEKRIFFTTDSRHAIKTSEVIFVAVGTPTGKNNEADLIFVTSVAKDIGKYMNDYKVIVNKSTVPVGTGELVKNIIKKNQKEQIEFDVVSNPEFLKEGTSIKDFMVPDRIVIGSDSDKAKSIMGKIYEPVARTGKPIFYTDIKSAELIKYGSNAMLATRISFMNELSHLSEKIGADIKKVAQGMGLDSRIGPRFLQAGVGYGGSCFPKDVQALIQTLKQNKCETSILEAVDKVNCEQKKSLLSKIKKLTPNLKDKTITIWGLSFKPKTDDIRGAPSLVVIDQLQKEGALINVFDPEAQEKTKKILNKVNYFKTPYEALKGSSCLVVVTEWDEFRSLDKEKIKDSLKEPNIIDGRNIYDPKEMSDLGFNYISVGR